MTDKAALDVLQQQIDELNASVGALRTQIKNAPRVGKMSAPPRPLSPMTPWERDHADMAIDLAVRICDARAFGTLSAKECAFAVDMRAWQRAFTPSQIQWLNAIAGKLGFAQMPAVLPSAYAVLTGHED